MRAQTLARQAHGAGVPARAGSVAPSVDPRRNGPDPLEHLGVASGNRAVLRTLNRTAAANEVTGVLRSRGRQLDDSVRSDFERRLDHDLAGVRVHTGPRAAESARMVDAMAYTSGQDIVFASGRYAPQTSDGRRLLAHELAHVVQHSRGDVDPATPSDGVAPAG